MTEVNGTHAAIMLKVVKGVAEGIERTVRDPSVTGADPVDRLNRQYMVVSEAGRAMIYRPTHDQMLNRRFYERLTFGDFRKLHMNDRVTVRKGEKTELKAVADIWLCHPERHQYLGGMIFDPSGKHVRPDMLNLWQGFAVSRSQAHGPVCRRTSTTLSAIAIRSFTITC